MKLSTRTFRTRTGRTVLTILGTSIGIAAILVFVSLGYGLQKIILEKITTSESLLSLDVSMPNGDIQFDEQKISQIRHLPNVEEVSPLAIFPGQATLNGLISDTSFYACEPSYFKLGGMTAKAGTLFDAGGAKKAVVSTALLKSFDLDPAAALGKEMQIVVYKPGSGGDGGQDVETFERADPYTISGVVDDDSASYAYVPLETFSDIGVSGYSQAKVKISQAKFIDGAVEKIVGMGYLVSSLSSTVDEANKIFGAIQIALAIFGLVALLVGAIGMANTMTVTLLERTNEIGIMKAIGASDSDIGAMFLTESVIMGFLGGVGGIILGFMFSGVFNWLLNMVAQSFGGRPVDLFFTPLWFIAFIAIFSTLVGLLSGIFPAKKAAAMNPLEALRYK